MKTYLITYIAKKKVLLFFNTTVHGREFYKREKTLTEGSIRKIEGAISIDNKLNNVQVIGFVLLRNAWEDQG